MNTKTTTQSAAREAGQIPKHIVILHNLIAAIDNLDGAKRFFNRSIDTGYERDAEAKLIRARRRYSKALSAARNFKAEEGF